MEREKTMKRQLSWWLIVVGVLFFITPTVQAQEGVATLTQFTLPEAVPAHWGVLRSVSGPSAGALILSLEDDRGDIRIVTIRQDMKSLAWRFDPKVLVIKRRP